MNDNPQQNSGITFPNDSVFNNSIYLMLAFVSQKFQALDIKRLTQTIPKALESLVDRKVFDPPLQVCFFFKKITFL